MDAASSDAANHTQIVVVKQIDDPKQELVQAGDSSHPIGFGPLDDAAIDKRVQQVTRRSLSDLHRSST
jgi:hypothetical protein